MSKPTVLSHDELPLSDELIASYLQDNPDFFQRNPELLLNLRLTDNQRGTVSLVERQQQQLRGKIVNLEEEITQLMSVANHNEQLFALYNDLYLRLLDCQSAEEILGCLHTTTTELLSLADCKLWLKPNYHFEHNHVINSDCSEIIENRLTKNNYYFGRLQQSEQQLIFDQHNSGSVVLIKLEQQEQTLGFLAIASHDVEHFDPTMDTLLLNQFKKLVAKLLVKHLQ